jgi:hypothetical protein
VVLIVKLKDDTVGTGLLPDGSVPLLQENSSNDIHAIKRIVPLYALFMLK